MNKKLLDSFLSANYEKTIFPPEISGRFTALECIESEFGETFVMKENTTGDLYVLKTHENSGTEADEARLLHGLNHKGLPEFNEVIEQGGTQYTLRRFIKGEPLSEYLTGMHDVNLLQAVNVLISLCDILIYLHNQPEPIIHRDIKPSNIIINPQDNSIMLIDFGIARKYSKNAKQDTTYFGTHQFAPPEQYGFAQTDCRSDIYSVGVLMRYWLTGSTDAKVTIDDKTLEKIAAKCTEIAPKMRFQSAEELKKALFAYKNKDKCVVVATVASLICCMVALFAGIMIWESAVGNAAVDLSPPAQIIAPTPDANNAPDTTSDMGENPIVDYSDIYPTPEGYNDNDYQKMITFFLQGNNHAGNADAIKSVNPNFDLNDPETWEWSTGQNRYNGVRWREESGELRIISIRYWNNWYNNEMNTTVGLTGELDVTGLSYMEHLSVSNNNITNVNFSENTILRHLDLSGNGLTHLDLTDLPKLTWLTLQENNLTDIDITENTLIEILDLKANHLTTLDVSNQIALREFICGENYLTALNLSNNINLRYLWFWSNDVSEQTFIVPADNNIMFIEARNNNLTNLSVFENFNKLCFLAIRNNFIDLEDSENRASIASIQATIDTNATNPPSGYAPPEWVEMKFGFIYEPQK
ncbi:MAG: protein kinase [Oscillospiraceae bacterium]|nr:protein kinase [Oscillospiraceae bacterium]